MEAIARPRGRLRQAVVDVARCVAPVECAGCGMPDVPLCQDCASAWWEPPLRCEEGAPRLMVGDEALLPVWAIAPLTGEVHEVIAAWKDAGRRDLDRVMQAGMERLAGAVAPAADLVVPVPSRPGASRRRGADLTWALARGAARALPGARPMRGLRLGAGESRGASARQRWRAAQGAIGVRGELKGRVLLVDDVVTTGATLAACSLALSEHHAEVVGALVLACA
ncbi:ComF family protein [Demequina globuliformis]|uniref:ComF family protein n=1 Tax=Demequina globuliformis TaxID=676202 RepID=UPI0007842ADB|nr:ComF family protein [Demequina globuliformis]